MSSEASLTEWQVRNLRNVCYGGYVSNAEWEKTKKNWCKPESIDWLEKHQFKLDYPTPTKTP